MKIFQTKAYRVIMGYVYGWGATAVIIGALFKIMHFPGAGVVLTVGMLVEALIFFLSVFEPQMEHYDWARVFPVLGKTTKEWDKTPKNAEPMVSPHVQTSAPTVTGHIDLGLEAEDLNRLKAGIHKIAETADSFATVIGTTPEMAQKITRVSESFDELGQRTIEMSKALQTSVEGFSSGCEGVNRILMESTKSLTEQIKSNCEKLSSNIGTSAERFGVLNGLMEEQCQQLKNTTGDYARYIAGINKNISALNALYELQVQETRNCLESFKGMQGDLGEMMENVSLGLDSTKLFKQESQQLAHHVASLNSVYGNMLSVMNNN